MENWHGGVVQMLTLLKLYCCRFRYVCDLSAGARLLKALMLIFREILISEGNFQRDYCINVTHC